MVIKGTEYTQSRLVILPPSQTCVSVEKAEANLQHLQAYILQQGRLSHHQSCPMNCLK
jgi:hypothetical protein